MLKTFRIPIITIFLVLFIDQFIKIFIKLNYPLGEVGRLGNWCIIHFTESPGMAFGMEFGGNYGKLALSIFRILASIAGLFYTYYERSDTKDRSARPLVISFNGGPGSASVWMHIAYTGPKLLNIDDEGYPVIRISSIQNGQVSLDGIARIPDYKLAKRN
jgi:hypothetical protein